MSIVEPTIVVAPAELSGDPEVLAFLQALYSRSPLSIKTRLTEVNSLTTSVNAQKLRENLNTYYVGYGHASIGDCGTSTVFIEDIPIYAAVAIENHALFRGQECSTRYLDFSNRSYHNPFLGSVLEDQAQEALEYLRSLYLDAFKAIVHNLSKKQAVNKKPIARAVNARAFDIARGLLPVGAHTNVAWSSTLREFRNHCRRMFSHPNEYIRALAERIYIELYKTYPASFEAKLMPKRENAEYWLTFEQGIQYKRLNRAVQTESWNLLSEDAKDGLLTRNPGEELTPLQADSYNILVTGSMDYGSYRDLNRHRVGMKLCSIPELGALDPWYVKMLDYHYPEWANRYQEYKKMIARLYQALPLELNNNEELLYFSVLGNQVFYYYSMNLGQFLYITELRSKMTVHPSLRREVQNWAFALQNLPVRNNYNRKKDASFNEIITIRGDETFIIKGTDNAL